MDILEETDVFLSACQLTQDESNNLVFNGITGCFESKYLADWFVNQINFGWKLWQAAKARAVPDLGELQERIAGHQYYHDEHSHMIVDMDDVVKEISGFDSWKAQAVPAKLVLKLEKGRFKEYEFKALLRQSLRASKVTRSKLNWVHVMSMLGTGSTVAHRICETLGVNPDGTEFKAQEPANADTNS